MQRRISAALIILMLGTLGSLALGCARHPSGSSAASLGQGSPPAPTPVPNPTPTPVPGAFARGQWTQFSNDKRSFAGALFVGDGSAPYDVLADGATSVKGQTLQQAEIGSGGPNAQLAAYSAGGIYVPSIHQFVALLTSGHYTGGSNEVNVFDLSSGTWNPGGRPVNPTVRLYMKVGGTWPISIAYGGYHLTVPVGLIDTGNDYSANISASQLGIQAAPVNRQIYGGIADMPGWNKIFLFGGFGYWDAPGGDAYVGCTYDYVTKKYQLLDAETWPAVVRTTSPPPPGIRPTVECSSPRRGRSTPIIPVAPRASASRSSSTATAAVRTIVRPAAPCGIPIANACCSSAVPATSTTTFRVESSVLPPARHSPFPGAGSQRAGDRR
jgi:hypothetical protein